MNKFFTYFVVLVATTLFAACSDNDIASIGSSEEGYSPKVIGTMTSVAEFGAGEGDTDPLAGKSALYYDRKNSKLKFTWAEGDKTGVFAEDDDDQQVAFIVDPESISEQEGSCSGVFNPVDGSIKPIVANELYYSYFPHNSEIFRYTAVPATFRGQVQTANERMRLNWGVRTPEELATFLQSEKDAAAHVGAYDYMAASATATAAAHVHFYYRHLATLIRFYMYCPGIEPGTDTKPEDDFFIDSLQVVNDEADFILDATVDISEATPTFTSTKISHTMSLKFNPSIDMSNVLEDDTKVTYDYWRTSATGKYYGYIMAYMMIAPIDLTSKANSKLYLYARKAISYYADVTEYNEAKGTSLTAEGFAALAKSEKIKTFVRKAYVATLSKLNFQAGKHVQWNATGYDPEEPIHFTPVSLSLDDWTEEGETIDLKD